MHTRTTWQINNVTHWATIIRDDCNGGEIRTDCGLVGNGCWESEINELAEVTCPRCRLSGGSNHTEPQADKSPEEKARKTRAANRSADWPVPTLLEGAELIHVYTREQAVSDGVLIDVTIPAREAGFRFPVAVTSLSGSSTFGHLWKCKHKTRRAVCGTSSGCCDSRSGGDKNGETSSTSPCECKTIRRGRVRCH